MWQRSLSHNNSFSINKNKRAITSLDVIIMLIIAFVTLFIVIAFISGFFSKIKLG